jgi:hypothetical protein
VQRVLLQSKTANAAIVEDAGTNQFQILHMANTKIFHHAGRNASGVSLQLEIDKHHNQWCRDNGYETIGYKPGPGRPKKKITSPQAQIRKRPSLRPRVGPPR